MGVTVSAGSAAATLDVPVSITGRKNSCSGQTRVFQLLDYRLASAGMKHVFTAVRLAEGASLAAACRLARVSEAEVDLTQSLNEKIAPDLLTEDFRVISFDGNQMTISERINGERRVRGFAVSDRVDHAA